MSKLQVLKKFLNQPEVASHADVLYKNLKSVKNRYNFLKTIQYRKKATLDEKNLSAFRDDWERSKDEIFEFQTKRVYSNHWNRFPNHSSMSATVRFRLGDLNLMPDEKHTFLLLVQDHYDRESDFVTLECSRFPMQSQNQKFLKDTLKRLLQSSRENGEAFTDIPVKHSINVSESLRKTIVIPKAWF